MTVDHIFYHTFNHTAVIGVFTDDFRRRDVGKGEDLFLNQFFEIKSFAQFGFQTNIYIFYLSSLNHSHSRPYGKDTLLFPT